MDFMVIIRKEKLEQLLIYMPLALFLSVGSIKLWKYLN